MYGKQKVQKEGIKTSFSGEDIPYDYCNATAVINVKYVFKQNKKYHPIF